MLGLLGLIILHGKKLSDYVRENIRISLLLKGDSSDEQIAAYRQKLRKAKYVHSIEYISREQAAKELSNDLGEDFLQFLDYNPLPATIDVRLKAGYTNADSIAKIEKQLNASNLVKEVVYQKSLIDVVNDNIRKISMVILGFSLLLIVIAIVLINNTIKLSIYARRFLIRSMQLVGATEGFIRRPFVMRSMLHGFIAAVLSIGLLAGTLWFASQRIPELKGLQDIKAFMILYALLIVTGVVLSGFSTFLAVRKFLRMKSDSLHMN
jgi:cell division transport system permease protein